MTRQSDSAMIYAMKYCLVEVARFMSHFFDVSGTDEKKQKESAPKEYAA